MSKKNIGHIYIIYMGPNITVKFKVSCIVGPTDINKKVGRFQTFCTGNSRQQTDVTVLV